MTKNTDALVSTEWLAAHLNDSAIRVVDGSFKMPGVTPLPIDDYKREHIPGAVFFPIDEISDERTSLPHMLPNCDKFQHSVSKLGIGNDHHVIVYGVESMLGAARVWWMFRMYSHACISVLDGGLRKWKSEGRPVDNKPVSPIVTNFQAVHETTLIRDSKEILVNIDTKTHQVIDARSAQRFTGEIAEPRPGLRQGHIPHSLNVDHAQLIDTKTGTIKSPDELRRIFEQAGVDLKRSHITTCGSGVSACVLALALYVLGDKFAGVYDGSWAEWGLPGDLPIETGLAR